MNISEDRLKELVLRVLRELEAERREGAEPQKRQKLYMICASPWNEGYSKFLGDMEHSKTYDIYPVIPLSWQKQGYENMLRSFKSCRGILYRSWEKPADIQGAVSLFPVVSRDTLVKTALCISDTFETSWIADCIEKGGRIVFLRSGLARFSGKEKPAYVGKIMEYCRQVLEYGVELCSAGELEGRNPCKQSGITEKLVKPEYIPRQAEASNRGKRRVITASNVEGFASGGILYLQPDDIVTDLAKDRAKFLNIIFK